MSKGENGFVTGVACLAAWALVIGALWGWVVNIIALAGNQGESVGLIALRIVGIFMAPLGSILGWAI